MGEIKSFRDLRTWQEAQALVIKVYKVTLKFPKEENYGLISQMRRAAVSVPTNIAEGMGRGTTKELIHFLIIARGSIHELLSLFITSHQLGYLTSDECEDIQGRYEGLNSGINVHIKSLTYK